MTTWIDSEELAYSSYSGRPSNSNRRVRVRFPDGKIRLVRLGVPDTFFSIPAKPSHGRIGFVTVAHWTDVERGEVPGLVEGDYMFHPAK